MRFLPNPITGSLDFVRSLYNYFRKGGNSWGAKATLGTTDNQDLGIITNNTERLTVLKGGNVGIGTTTPSKLFSVGTNNNFTVDSLGNTTVGVSNTENHTNPAQLIFGSYQTSAGGNSNTFPEFIFNGPSNWMGLGQASLSGNSLRLGAISGAGAAFPAMGTYAFNFIVDGNVGIGTTTPSQQLEITKNFRLPATTYNSGAPYGVIYKGADIFIHDFSYGLNSGGITPAGRNTFVGVNAGNLTMGSTATNVGEASYNTATGWGSLRANTTGNYNSAQGYISLGANTTGFHNSAQGGYTLANNTTGNYNSAQGMYALIINTTGSNNSAQGYASLFSNTTGGNNSAQGYDALRSNTTGGGNSAQGNSSLYSNTTGSYNSAQGMYAGRYIADGTTGRTTGNNGLYLGYNSKASANGTDNEIVIGYNAIGKGSNTATYGNSSMTKHIFEAGNVGIGTTAPNSKLQVNGSLSLPYVEKTANYTATISDYTINCTANTFTITLPTAVGISGRIYTIKNSGTGVITVDANASETIDGNLTVTLSKYDALKIQSTNAGWIII